VTVSETVAAAVFLAVRRFHPGSLLRKGMVVEPRSR
jgi:hypothetical protein